MKNFAGVRIVLAVMATAITSLSLVAPVHAAAATAERSNYSTGEAQRPVERFTIKVAGVTFPAAQTRELWAACGTNDDPGKLVRSFDRVAGPFGPKSDLLCGTAGFGYRHIKDRHMTQWQTLAGMVGSNWRDFADFAIAQILKAPEPGSPTFDQARNTWTYRSPVQIIDQNGVVRDTYRPFVIVAHQDTKIITAYPAR
ncbi:hypothetical protein [Saccharopolyspora gregorii]